MMIKLAIHETEAEIVASMKLQHTSENDLRDLQRGLNGRLFHSTMTSAGSWLTAVAAAL